MREIVDLCRGWLSDKLVSLALTVAPEEERGELAEAVMPVYVRRIAAGVERFRGDQARRYGAGDG